MTVPFWSPGQWASRDDGKRQRSARTLPCEEGLAFLHVGGCAAASPGHPHSPSAARRRPREAVCARVRKPSSAPCLQVRRTRTLRGLPPRSQSDGGRGAKFLSLLLLSRHPGEGCSSP